MLVKNPIRVTPDANTAAAPMTHISTTFNRSRNSSCFSSNLSIFNCITVIRVSCDASSPKSDIILFQVYYVLNSLWSLISSGTLSSLPETYLACSFLFNFLLALAPASCAFSGFLSATFFLKVGKLIFSVTGSG